MKTVYPLILALGIAALVTAQVASQRAQSLYLEVRQGQTPAQTDTWFALE